MLINLWKRTFFSIFARIFFNLKSIQMKMNFMMMGLLAFGILSVNAKGNDPVVMTINGQPVTRSEFEYFYNKNNEQDVIEQKSFDEYVELFVNYKLKVQEALSRGIDTTQAYIDELEGYRKQLAEPYLLNENWKDQAVEEIIRNRKEEVHAAHILVRLDEKASPKKVAEAYARIDSIRMELEAGASFDSLARVKSEDPSARQNGGDLGYFSVMQMVYPFEKAAYETPVGEVATLRSQFGVHLLKVIDRRPARPEVLVAHIMKTFSRNVPPQIAAAQTKPYIDSVYQVLKGGKPFAEVAASASDDQYTSQRGGAYPWLNSSARFPEEWMSVAYALKKGEISEPFTTDYGWHIMTKLDERSEAPADSAAMAELREMITRDPSRAESYRRQQQETWMLEDGMKVNEYVLSGKNRNKVFMTIGKQKYTAQQFDDWCQANYGDEAGYVKQADALDAYKRAMITEYEDAHLADKYSEFRNLYKEYHDGILLFDVAGGEVWDKAAQDTIGLEQYFEAHRAKYAWELPHFKGAFIECADDTLLVEALKNIYDNHSDIQECADLVRSQILTDTILTPNPKVPRFHIVNGLYAPGDNNTVDRERLHINVKPNDPRANMPVRMTYGRVVVAPESVDDVRSAVVADYQNELEEKWVAELRAKFPVVLNQKQLDKLRK